MIDLEPYKSQLSKHAAHYGLGNRLDLLMEECGELIQAAARYGRYLNGDATLRISHFPYLVPKQELTNELTGEIADVMILITELCELLEIKDEMLEKVIRYKLNRTDELTGRRDME